MSVRTDGANFVIIWMEETWKEYKEEATLWANPQQIIGS